MAMKRRNGALMMICAILLPLYGCVMEVSGIPVKSYRPPAADLALLEKQRQEMLAEVSKMSQIKENNVFTERRGVPEYIIGPGDVLTLNYWMPYSSQSAAPRGQGTVEGFMLNTFDVVVRPDGKITYSFGDDIPVGGHTASEVREMLLDGIRHYIRNPRLEVIVKEHKSKNVLLFGQINNLQTGVSGPGKYPLTGKITALDLIVSAGGPITGRSGGGGVSGAATRSDYWGAANGDMRNVELVRNGKKYTLNLYTAMFRGDMSQNVFLENGDVITVPEEPTFAQRVYVFGQVNSPGIFRLRDANDVLTAIAQTGGTTPVAIKSDIKIIRGYEEGQRRPLVLSVNLDEILKRGDLAQNVPLHDGDLVYIPRMIIGDINEFINNINPLLNFTTGRPTDFRSAFWKDPNSFKW
ncbi:MAG: polysaccharide biosynthesis/export family protein [Syntrophales bacterium]|nr:polysaccharide biosynthesis/export family protein [Syntrophales bacterium]